MLFEEHKRHQKIKQKDYLKHLIGKINVILQINSIDAEFKRNQSFLMDLENKQDIPNHNK